MDRSRSSLAGYLFATLVGFLLVFGTARAASDVAAPDSTIRLTSNKAHLDSILATFSPEELLRYQQFYRQEITRLQEEIRLLRKKGIQSGEDFLNRHPESKVVDKVLMRLAEFYYQEAQEAYQRAMEEYEHQLALLDSGRTTVEPQEPQKDYSRALELYRAVVEEHPNSRYVDAALYNIAFLTEDEGRRAEALEVYQQLVDRFPHSRYTPEALMRIAEYYFNPPVNQIEKAIGYYKRILAFHDTPRYDEALYRLGWCYYRLSDYPNAIAYFTLLADDINLANRHDPEHEISNPALQAESVEYIGLSFMDFGGPERAARFLKDIGDRNYGFKIIKRIGDAYFDEKEEFAKAIEAYKVLLSLYPYAPEAPEIQQRIVVAYERLGDEQMAAAERLKLFREYGPGSQWWAKNETKQDVRQKADALARKALLDNLAVLLKKAKASGDSTAYADFVRQSRLFLDEFAGDSLAAQVHWNLALVLDTKLGRRDEAYQQYIALSNTYLGTKYQKMAAENAVALAGEAVEKLKADSVAVDSSQLSEEEKRLLEAYDNYIRLFPDDEKTSLMLANAGALYYSHRRFDDALRYFKTLVKRFPDSPYLAQARMTIMESYFGKKDYRSTEIVAKRILADSSKPELFGKAKRRLAEAIFLHAQELAKAGQHDLAGKEYMRMATEVPDADFADLALFNAGLEFDKVKSYKFAIEAYRRLLEGYPTSKYRLDGMNNLALDLGEEKQYAEAARLYEQLADLQPDSARAQDALYNASVFYVRAKDWQDAIRVNRRYVDRYPNAKESDDLFFDIATYYLKLGDLASANRIYGEYAQRFPDSPRVVESYFHRGEFYSKQGQQKLAVQEFKKAVEHGKELKARGLDSNPYYQAEALFALSEIKWREYKSIAFRLPESNLQQAKKRKADLLKELVANYTEVVTYGTPRLYEATYRIGEAYEDFADTWARQDVAETDPTRRAVLLKKIDEEAAKLYEQAVDAYMNGAKALERISREYAAAHPDTSTKEKTTRVAEVDSTLELAQKWIVRTKGKVPEVVYKIAETNFHAAERLLAAPVPAQLNPVARLEYWHQLYSRAVQPIVDATLREHERNLKLAKELGVAGGWADSSRKRIAEVSTLVAQGYRKLAERALEHYRKLADELPKLAALADSTGSGEDRMYDVAGEIGHFLDYAKDFAKIASDLYFKAFERMSQHELGGVLYRYETAYLADAYEQAMACDSLANEAAQRKEWAKAQQQRTGGYVWEDCGMTFEDAFYSLSDIRREVLESAYHLADTLGVRTPVVGQIMLALVQTDPEKYAGVLGLKLAKTVITTDSTWQVMPADSDLATEPMLAVLLGSQPADSGQMWQRIWVPEDKPVAADSALSDSAQLGAQRTGGHWKFVRYFELNGLPARGKIKIALPGAYDLYVNGEYIAHVDSAADSTGGVHEHDVTNFLREGKNVAEVVVNENNVPPKVGLAAVMQVEYIPGWRAERQRFGMATEDRQLERFYYFDKNRIPEWQLTGGAQHAQKLADHELPDSLDPVPDSRSSAGNGPEQGPNNR